MPSDLILRLYQGIQESVRKTPVTTPINTYVGPISHRVQGFHIEVQGEGAGWELHTKDSRRFYEPNFRYGLLDLLEKYPLGRKGMVPSAINNLVFLQKELGDWCKISRTSGSLDPWMYYRDMWDGIPNVSEMAYSKLAGSRLIPLVKRAQCIQCHMSAYRKQGDYMPPERLSRLQDSFHALNRYMILRFGPGDNFCPISWQVSLDSIDSPMMNVIAHFRSLEVSRNLLNDLYLLFGYFEKIWSFDGPIIEDEMTCSKCPSIRPEKSEMISLLPIRKMLLTSSDAHVINL